MRKSSVKISCSHCRASWSQRRHFLKPELEALSLTRLTDMTKYKQPVVTAVLLLSREITFLPGMKKPGWVNYEKPTFFCPWSTANKPAIISHGIAWRSDCGHGSDIDVDNNFCTNRASHCHGDTQPGGYYILPFSIPGLRRRVIT